MYQSSLSFLLVLLASVFAQAQTGQGDPIYLDNPSFEDFPRAGKPPTGWYDCGFPNETPPDVQPSNSPGLSFFRVTKEPFHGKTYMGMVVRDNDTWESVSQRLKAPLEPGTCYEFSLHLSRSEIYVSQSRSTFEEVNYTTPAKLRIWGGSGYCNKKELLAESSLVINTRWLQYNFKFEPKDRHTYIVLEAFYNTPTLFPYNGNILVDNATPIVPVPCIDEVAVAQDVEEPPLAPVVRNQPDTPTTPSVVADNNAEEPKEKSKLIAELERDKIRAGQTIRIDRLYFTADSSRIKEESYEVLEELFEFLNSNPDVVVEIGGHTNSIPSHEYCDRLSTSRAKAVADYLVQRGIPRQRLQYKGYGKRQPVASNETPDGRQRNQRVEIKILGFDG